MVIPWEDAGYYRDEHGVKRLGPGARTAPKEYCGPEGVSKFSGARGINFHNSSMKNRHGAGSSFAKNRSNDGR